MKFVLQIEEDKQKLLNHDFIKKVVEMRDLYKQLGNPYSIQYASLSGLDEFASKKKSNLIKYIPVGTTDFVQKFMHLLGGPEHIKPFNVPKPLMTHTICGRIMYNIENENDLNLCKQFIHEEHGVYVKDLNIIKHPDNGVLKFVVEEDNEVRTGDFGVRKLTYKNAENFLIGKQISELFAEDILSEWRVFVFKDEIVGCQNYIGDPITFPIRSVIENVSNSIKQLKESYGFPSTYSFDVAVFGKNNHRQTKLIEMHDFFSLGLYGFEHIKYIYMLSHSWYNILMRYGLKFKL